MPNKLDCTSKASIYSAWMQDLSCGVQFGGFCCHTESLEESMAIQLWSLEQSHCGMIGSGSFNFQYQLVIPFHVPSSLGRRNASADISYKIEARAVSTVVATFQFDYK